MPAASTVDLAGRYRRILVFGAGGGGDVLGAYYYTLRIRRLGGDALAGSVVWERHAIDPYPGPIPLETLVDAEPLGWTLALVNGNTVSLRYGSTVKPQVARLAMATGEETVFIDLSKGAEGVLAALEAAVEELGVDAIVGVDTGGDILARGDEESLWSPLADALSLYALSKAPVDSYLLVLSPGADGELPWTAVLERVSLAARRGGLIEVLGLSREEYETLKKLEGLVESEASRIPLRAFEGVHGTVKIRGGTRTVTVTPCQASAYLLDPRIVAENSMLPGLVEGTRGIGQASQMLNRKCIVTELDLEMELSRLMEKGVRPETVDLVGVKRRLRGELEKRYGCRGSAEA